LTHPASYSVDVVSLLVVTFVPNHTGVPQLVPKLVHVFSHSALRVRPVNAMSSVIIAICCLFFILD
jgi:hypothetical protein